MKKNWKFFLGDIRIDIYCLPSFEDPEHTINWYGYCGDDDTYEETTMQFPAFSNDEDCLKKIKEQLIQRIKIE